MNLSRIWVVSLKEPEPQGLTLVAKKVTKKPDQKFLSEIEDLYILLHVETTDTKRHVT